MWWVFIWCCIAVLLAPIVGYTIRKMGEEETLPLPTERPSLTLVKR